MISCQTPGAERPIGSQGLKALSKDRLTFPEKRHTKRLRERGQSLLRGGQDAWWAPLPGASMVMGFLCSFSLPFHRAWESEDSALFRMENSECVVSRNRPATS